MKVAYFNCFAGVSGDMVVGALVDLGMPLELLESELKKISIGDYEIGARRVTRKHIGAIKFDVTSGEQRVVRTWSNIRDLIKDSALPGEIKKDSLAIFERIAEAEAKIHQKPIDQVHFHEVGAIDSIVDVVSSVVGINHLGIEKVYSSPVATGMGMVKTEHGLLPVPTPATLELLEGAPIYSSNISTELATPTGAAILTHYATFTEQMPEIRVEKTGYGAGSRELEIPNALRIILGEELERSGEVVLIETNIDDVSAEVLGYTMEALLELGALDVWFTPIEMKKNRPAVALSVLVPVGYEDIAVDKVFSETSTLGLRVSRQSRRVAERETLSVDTPFGKVRVKVGKYKGQLISVAPEYDDCRKIAMREDMPIKEIFEAARRAAYDNIQKG